MAPKPKYRLQPILDQKEKAKKDGEQALADAHRKLAEEEEKKRAMEQEKENLLLRIEDAKEKRDKKAMEGELTVQESQSFKLFIQGLHERRKEMDLQIYKQTKAIERAAEAVERAKVDLIQKAKEFEAMSKHKEQFIKQIEVEEQKKEQKLMEEIGMIQFMKRRAEKQ